METLEKILQLVVTPTAIVAAITYILRGYLDTSFKEKQFEYETKFSTLHTKRGEVIAQLYSLLAESEILISDLVSPLQFPTGTSLIDKKQETVKAYNKLTFFYSQNRIYFPENICVMMDDAMTTLRSSLSEFDIAHQLGMHGEKEYKPDDTGLWVSSWKIMNEKFVPIKKELEKEFRVLLGVK